MHWDKGINELKTQLIKENPSGCSNLLNFINELSQLREVNFSEDDVSSSPNSPNGDLPILATVSSRPKLVDQVCDAHKHLTKNR